MKIYGLSQNLCNNKNSQRNLQKQASHNAVNNIRSNAENLSASSFSRGGAQPALSRDIVCFGNREREKINYNKKFHPVIPNYPRNLNIIKDLKDLPCIYCGEPILSNKDKKRLANQIANAKGAELIKHLKSPDMQKYLRNIKPNIADSVCRQARLHPVSDLQQLLVNLVPNYINELEMEQIYVLRNIMKKFHPVLKNYAAQDKLQSFIENAYEWIKYKNSITPFKRKSFIYDLEELLKDPDFKDKKLCRQIYNEALKMPKSFESENAFIVKYSRRSNREIADQLLYEASSTLEHIQPQQANGETVMSNLSIADAYCNNVVRRHTPIDEFYETHPEIKDNIKKNLDRLRREGFIEYVSDLAKRYMIESKRHINLKEYMIGNINEFAEDKYKYRKA